MFSIPLVSRQQAAHVNTLYGEQTPHYRPGIRVIEIMEVMEVCGGICYNIVFQILKGYNTITVQSYQVHHEIAQRCYLIHMNEPNCITHYPR